MMAGMPFPQTMAAVQQRTARNDWFFSHDQALSHGPVRPTQTPGQMMNTGGAIRQSRSVLNNNPAAYTRTARNLPQNVILNSNPSTKFIFHFDYVFRILVDMVIQLL